MNWHEVQMNWPEMSKKAKSNWQHLSKNDIDATQGNPARLSTLIQATYHCDAREADQQLELWLGNLLGSTENSIIHDPALEAKLDENLDTPETIEERDAVIGSPYHKGY